MPLSNRAVETIRNIANDKSATDNEKAIAKRILSCYDFDNLSYVISNSYVKSDKIKSELAMLAAQRGMLLVQNSKAVYVIGPENDSSHFASTVHKVLSTSDSEDEALVVLLDELDNGLKIDSIDYRGFEKVYIPVQK